MPQAVISVLELCNFTDSFSCSGTSEEAAAAYEMSQGEYRGFGMAINIDLSSYIRWWQPNKSLEVEPSAPRHMDESHSMSEERPT